MTVALFTALSILTAVMALAQTSAPADRPVALYASVGADLWVRDKRSLRLQADAINLTDRLNVINFAGLLSGTALAAPRSLAVRLQTEW